MLLNAMPMRALLSVVFSGVLAGVAAGQALDVNKATQLKPGVNRATIDSFGGPQYWYVMAAPGSFSIMFAAGSAQEMVTLGGKAAMLAMFNPKTPGAVITQRETNAGTTFSGSVKVATRVLVGVEPKKSALVRQTTDYTLTVTGDVLSGAAGEQAMITAAKASGGKVTGGAATDGVVGMYEGGDGATKFTADGQIVTAQGDHGHWEVFDADTKTYVVVLGGRRTSVTLQPGRGLVDGHGNLLFTLKH